MKERKKERKKGERKERAYSRGMAFTWEEVRAKVARTMSVEEETMMIDGVNVSDI